MTEEDRATLKRIEEKIDLLLARLPEFVEGELVAQPPPDRIASAFERLHARRK